MLKGFGHYEVYVDPAFTEVMEPTLAWFQEHLPARSPKPAAPKRSLLK
jgi:hypothetical protein